MKDRIVYNSGSLDAAVFQLRKLQDALDEVKVGLTGVDTSAQWWSKLKLPVGDSSIEGVSALRTYQSHTGSAEESVSQMISGVIQTQQLFDDAERKANRSVQAVGVEKANP